MDDNQRNQNTQNTPPAVHQQVDSGGAQQPGQVSQPVGGRKETEAVADKIAKEEGDEYWEAYSREIELEKELEELGGIEKVESGEIKVPRELAEEMGVKPTVSIETPIETATGFSIRGVSLSDDQLTAGLTKPTSTGIRWLVEWFIYQLLKAHFFIKRIGRRIIRQKVKVYA
jgi:hypothetical protein